MGLWLSLICLLLCILTFLLVRPIQGSRTTVHLHLCICLFLGSAIFLVGIENEGGQVRSAPHCQAGLGESAGDAPLRDKPRPHGQREDGLAIVFCSPAPKVAGAGGAGCVRSAHFLLLRDEDWLMRYAPPPWLRFRPLGLGLGSDWLSRSVVPPTPVFGCL